MSRRRKDHLCVVTDCRDDIEEGDGWTTSVGCVVFMWLNNARC